MDTYLEFIPSELISIIFEYLQEYDDVKSFAKISRNYLPNRFFEMLFKTVYPLLYNDRYSLKSVIMDDIYLVSTGDPWLELYAMLEKNNYVRSLIVNNYYIEAYEPSTVITRSIFKSRFPEVYDQLVKVESFNFERLKLEPIVPRYYAAYAFPWINLLEIYNRIYNLPGKYIVDPSFDYNMITEFFNSIVQQENIAEILNIIFQDNKILNYFIKNSSVILRYLWYRNKDKYESLVLELKKYGINL